MSANSKIEWTDHTFNPWIGCTKVSPGCAHCYAETEDKRRGWTPEGWGKGKPRKRTTATYWKQAIKWNAVAAAAGCGRPRVFPSLCDWLDPEVPIEWLADFLQLIHDTPNLDWLLLTKRPEKFSERINDVISFYVRRAAYSGWLYDWFIGGKPPHNVWLGVSVEDQKRADERIPILLQTPAAIRFLSCEPLLGPINIGVDNDNYAPFTDNAQIDWVIIGGESGTKARPCNVDWIRDIVAQCQAASVPVFVKQLGAYVIFDNPTEPAGKSYAGKLRDRKGGDPSEWPEELRIREFPTTTNRGNP